MSKFVYLQTYGWPLFRDCDTFGGHHAGLPDAGGRTTIIYSIAMLSLFFCSFAYANSLEQPDMPTALYERKGNKIVDAPLEDFELAKTYHSFKEKGRLSSGQRITIMTKRDRYKVGEPIRVLHILEAVKQGVELYVMGPKTIYNEYVDGKLVTKNGPGSETYDGVVVKGPNTDFHYDITTYIFSEPGTHTIQWRGGGHPIQGSLNLESNIIKIQIVE